MKIQYIVTKEEINEAKQKLWELKQAALLSRDAGMMNQALYSITRRTASKNVWKC